MRLPGWAVAISASVFSEISLRTEVGSVYLGSPYNSNAQGSLRTYSRPELGHDIQCDSLFTSDMGQHIVSLEFVEK